VRQITSNLARVFSRQLDLSVEGEIRADEDSGSGYDSRWKSFVVGVAHADHRTILLMSMSIDDLEQTEVSAASLVQTVGFLNDPKTVLLKRILYHLENFQMRKRGPGWGMGWCFDTEEVVASGNESSAMAEQFAKLVSISLDGQRFSFRVWVSG